MRAEPNYGHVPIVALTAYALPGDRTDFLKQGFDAYLSKPFEIGELVEMVSKELAG